MHTNTCFAVVSIAGALWEARIEYIVHSDDSVEIHETALIGAYLKGDNLQRRDYTSLGCDVPFWYDGLDEETQHHIEEAASRDCVFGGDL